jgi:hypothetical protein
MSTLRTENSDLCVLGAGIAGLNALYAASQYLTKDQRVILIDKRPAPGGMWTETYDYVRLHQPHPMFTAGNIPWSISRERSHLATKQEVLGQFAHCLSWLRDRIDLIEYYGYTYLEHREVPNGNGHEVHITCASPGSDEPGLVIRAAKCVKAFGFRIPTNDPLHFSSGRVPSVSPHIDELLSDEMNRSDEPIYILGGGKTGMDTAYQLIDRYPHKKLNLVVGAGTVFLDRNKTFPKGLKRWWGGTTNLRQTLDLTLRFDGDNEREVFAYFKRKYAVGLRDDFEQFVLGILSEEENEAISRGTDEVISEYVDDVVDTADDGVEMVFRGGGRRAIEAGSWIVNCTGYVLKETYPHEPYVSEHGAVVSVQPTSGIHVLTTFGAYFLVHLLYLGKLRTLPLYEMNYQALVQKDKTALPFSAMTQTLYNAILIADAVPGQVMRDCGLDFDWWYPFHRRIPEIIRMKRNKARYLAHFERSLARVRERFGIECGVLPHVASQREPHAISQTEATAS